MTDHEILPDAELRVLRVINRSFAAVLLLMAALGVVHDADLGLFARIVGFVCVATTGALYGVVLHDVLHNRRPSYVATALLVAAALTGMGVSYAWWLVVLAVAAVAIVLPGRRGVIALAALLVPVVPVLAVAMDGSGVVQVLMVGIFIVVFGLVLYVFTRMELALEDLRITREQLARVEIDNERNRISRDLHDILGRTLVAISMRSQTALRVVDRDPDLCRAQLDDIVSTTQKGQEALRSLVRGGIVVDADSEVEAARGLLDRLRITATIVAEPVAGHEVDPDVDRLAARIIREGTTNLLKHARPRRVELTVRVETATLVVVLVNDGTLPAVEVESGTGLTDLAGRVTRIGGSLEAGRMDGRRFRLVARLPLHVAAGPAPGNERGERGDGADRGTAGRRGVGRPRSAEVAS